MHISKLFVATIVFKKYSNNQYIYISVIIKYAYILYFLFYLYIISIFLNQNKIH
jgi:hypothetical protein